MEASSKTFAAAATLASTLAACDLLIGLGPYHNVACAFDCGTDATMDSSDAGDVGLADAPTLDAPFALEASPPPEGGYPAPVPYQIWAHWPMPNPDAPIAPDSSTLLPHPMSYDAGAEGGSMLVYDEVTHLTWWRASWPATSLDAADGGAWAACANLSGAGWRVPTRIELVSLVDFTRTSGPLIDPVAFPGTQAASYWTSSTVPGDGGPSGVWSVSFSSGLASYDGTATYVLCVTGGTQDGDQDACP